jgi:hypothetical protein
MISYILFSVHVSFRVLKRYTNILHKIRILAFGFAHNYQYSMPLSRLSIYMRLQRGTNLIKVMKN